MRELGFTLKREGNSWLLDKDFDDGSANEIVLFIKKHSYTSSADEFKKLHIKEWCDFRAWEKHSIGGTIIGGNIDFLPFSMVEEYIDFFNNLYQTLKEETE